MEAEGKKMYFLKKKEYLFAVAAKKEVPFWCGEHLCDVEYFIRLHLHTYFWQLIQIIIYSALNPNSNLFVALERDEILFGHGTSYQSGSYMYL